MPQALEHYAHAFAKLNCNRSQGHPSPHKPAMLLAVMDLFEGGEALGNRFRYEQLLEPFGRYFRIVRSAYDLRCSACGLRVILQDGLSIVDAAHLVPFSLSGDNSPANGMAVCKNHHWAMDRNLIAPCPGMKWHVSAEIDERIEGQKSLCELDGQRVVLPRDKAYHPTERGLQWRPEKLT